jgi:hypothetical protein
MIFRGAALYTYEGLNINMDVDQYCPNCYPFRLFSHARSLEVFDCYEISPCIYQCGRNVIVMILFSFNRTDHKL